MRAGASPGSPAAGVCAKRLAWRAALIGLGLHAAATVLPEVGAADGTRAALLLAAALSAALLWTRARPVVEPLRRDWVRAVLEAAVVGPPAALFAGLLGWSATVGPHP